MAGEVTVTGGDVTRGADRLLEEWVAITAGGFRKGEVCGRLQPLAFRAWAISVLMRCTATSAVRVAAVAFAFGA